MSFSRFKKQALIHALETNYGNKSLAAKDLGVCLRTVRNWINEFGLKKRFRAVNQHDIKTNGT